MRRRQSTGGILADARGAADEDGDERAGGYEGGVGGADEVEVNHGGERIGHAWGELCHFDSGSAERGAWIGISGW